jgi:WD40 repeat protein/uncharacterized protein YjbI with pentapeptide repeats
MTSAVQVPRKYNGAADSLAMAFSTKGPDLPNVKEYVEAIYNGLADLHERRRIHIPHGFPKQVFALSLAPSGKLIAAAVHGHVLFYDVDSGQLVHSEQTPPGWVPALSWSPDGDRIYVGTSPVGRILAPCSVKALQKYFTDYSKNKWDLSVDIGNQEFPAGTGAWSHDSKSILVAGRQRQASIWDPGKGPKARFISGIGGIRLKRNPLDAMVSDIAASADGQRIAVGAASGKIHIFQTRSGGQVGFSLRLEKSLDAITNLTPYSISFDPLNPDRLFVAYLSSSQMFLWKIDDNAPSDPYADEQSGPVWRVVWDPKGKFVASASNDHVVRLWTLPDADSAVQMRGHLSSVFSVDISSQGGLVASASFDGTIRLWAKGSPLSPILLPRSASIPAASEFSVENRQILVRANRGKKYWGMLPQEFGRVRAAAVSANGKGMAVVPQSGRPALLVEFFDYLRPVSVTLPGVKAEWTAVAFIEGDTRIAARTKEGKIFSWPFYPDVRSLEHVAKEHLPLVRDGDGLEKRLEVPSFMSQAARVEVAVPANSSKAHISSEYIIPFWRDGEVANAKSLKATSESRQKSIQWLANNVQIIDLNDTIFHNFNLDRLRMVPDSSFARANLENGSFAECVLQGVNFMRANLTNLTFATADLQGASFDGAVVSKTSFQGADLRFARFDGARLLSDVNFSQVDLNESSFRNVTCDGLPSFCGTAWWLASGWKPDQLAEFVKQFGGASPERRRAVGEYPMLDRELSRFETMLKGSRINTSQRVVALDGMAWTLAIHGVDLEEAERISRDALKAINSARLSNQDKTKSLSYVSDTLAYILLQKHQAEEAREVKDEAHGAEDPGGIFRYAFALYISGNGQRAYDLLSGSDQVKSYSPSHELYLLHDYLFGHGNGFMKMFDDVAKLEHSPTTKQHLSGSPSRM